jgi:hypothetical protein
MSLDVFDWTDFDTIDFDTIDFDIIDFIITDFIRFVGMVEGGRSG